MPMNPDTPEARIGRLEQMVAKLEQRVDDLLDRLAHQFKDLDDDVRAFAPIVREVDAVKAELRLIATGQRDVQQAIADLRKRMEQDSKDRDQSQKEALKDSRQWRRALILGSFAVLSAVIAATATIIAAGIG